MCFNIISYGNGNALPVNYYVSNHDIAGGNNEPILVEAQTTDYEGYIGITATYNCEFLDDPLPEISWTAINRETGIEESVSSDVNTGTLIADEPPLQGSQEISSLLTIFVESIYETPTCTARSNGNSISITSDMFSSVPLIMLGMYTCKLGVFNII